MGSILSAFQKPRNPLTSELKDILRLLNELEDHNLTNWETEFVASIKDTIAVYQGEAYLSDAQGDWLNKLADKYDLTPT